jgi:RNA polymerase sigma-70 factor (ECF subfamily)
MHEPSDRALVLRTREGEVDAYGDLVRRYQTMVFNTCFRLCGERRQAEDLTQEAFLRGFERLHTFGEDRPFGPWIRTVATNLCFNHLQASRLQARDAEFSEEVIRPGDTLPSDPDQIFDRDLEHEAIHRAILQLPPPQRVVIEMRHFQGLAYEEIAAELKISIGKVKTDLFRARKTLAELLEELSP